MKRSEKLLDAIGQIDDRLVEEAAQAGEDNVLQGAEAKAGSRRAKGHTPRKLKKVSLYRLQGALTACAVLAVCIGIFGLLEQSGMIFGPYGTKSADTAEMAVEDANENMAAQSAQAAAEAMPEEAVPEEEAAAKGAQAEAVTAKEAGAGELPAEEAPTGKMSDGDIPEEAQERKEAEKQGDEAAPRALAEGKLEELPEEKAKVQDAQPGPEAAPTDEEAGQQESAQDVQSLGSVNGVAASLVTTSAESITFVLENGGNESICYGEAYSLERFANGSWEIVKPVKEQLWYAVGYVQEPDSSREITVSIGSYGKLETGKYRLVKEYWLESDEEEAEKDKYPIYVEFMIAE